MQTILGANGTIGSLLAKELTGYTKNIRLVSRNPRKVNETDELFPADLSDTALVDKAIEGSEVVYLLVGFEYNSKVWQEKWPKLMKAVIDACVKYNAKLVFFDNVYMYDMSEIPYMTEKAELNPPSRKGIVRNDIANMILASVTSGKLTALIARSADFYGPKNERSLLNILVYDNMRKGKKPQWPIDINKKHSFTYTPDAAKATALLGNTADAYNQVWHLPTHPDILTGKEMINLFAKETNTPFNYSVVPLWMFKLLGLFMPIMREMPEMMYQYDRDYYFDSSKFSMKFNFTTTSYSEGVKEIVRIDK